MLKFTLFTITEYAGPPTWTFISWAHGAPMRTSQPRAKPRSARIHPRYTGPRRTHLRVLEDGLCSPGVRMVLNPSPSLPSSLFLLTLSNLYNSLQSHLLGWVTRGPPRSRLGTGSPGQRAGNLCRRPREKASDPLHWSCRFGLIHKTVSVGNELSTLMPPDTVHVFSGWNSSVSENYSAGV